MEHMNNIEFRWLVTDLDKVLQYRVKYQVQRWPVSMGVSESIPYNENVWGDWTNVKEVYDNTKESK